MVGALTKSPSHLKTIMASMTAILTSSSLSREVGGFVDSIHSLECSYFRGSRLSCPASALLNGSKSERKISSRWNLAITRELVHVMFVLICFLGTGSPVILQRRIGAQFQIQDVCCQLQFVVWRSQHCRCPTQILQQVGNHKRVASSWSES